MGPVFRVRQQDELGVLVTALVVAVRVGVRQWGCLFRSSVGPSTSHSRPGWAPLLPTLTPKRKFYESKDLVLVNNS